MDPFATSILELLVTIPGVGRRVAEVIIAEIGIGMSVFASDAHLASWAAVCPGNNSSAGRHYSGATRKGNVWLLDALTQAAWAAGRVKDDYLSAQFWRLARRIGKTKAVVAVAHSILVIVYHVIATGQPYHDLGSDYFTTRVDPERRARHLARQLRRPRLPRHTHQGGLTPAALPSRPHRPGTQRCPHPGPPTVIHGSA
jgi:transposase